MDKSLAMRGFLHPALSKLGRRKRKFHLRSVEVAIQKGHTSNKIGNDACLFIVSCSTYTGTTFRNRYLTVNKCRLSHDFNEISYSL